MNLLPLVIALSVLSLTAQEKAGALTDDLGNPFLLISHPQRIVSLAPNITEILFSLGIGDRVVGVTRYCDYPPQAADKEKIGGIVDPNLEKIESLHPDLVIGFRGNPLRLLDKLRSFHLPVFVLNEGKSLDDLFPMIEKIGRLIQEEEKARTLLSSLSEKYRKIQGILLTVSEKPKVFLSIPGHGFWTCGRESYLHDLLVRAKSINIAGAIPRKWLHLNREQIIRDNPDLIIIMAKSSQDFVMAKGRFTRDTFLGGVRAVSEGKFFFLDENMASRFGPRLIDAYAEVAGFLHPEQFRIKE